MAKAHKYKMFALGALALCGASALQADSGSPDRGGSALAARPNEARPQFTLAADAYWRLGTTKKSRFDASGLLWREGKLLTVNDRGSELFEIALRDNRTADLLPTKFFPQAAMIKAAGAKTSRFDCEGLAMDRASRIYLCEESQRGIYRSSADGKTVELLPIDWTPVARYFKGGINASFEGIAIGGEKLYVANERDAPRIIVVDLQTLRVESSFAVSSAGFAFGGPHYSDLAFFEGKLFVLDRNHRCILEVDPSTEKVLAEYRFGQMEMAEEFAYITDYPTGTMEGLAVDEEFFWLVTDNNGRGRFKDREDFRPTLFRCKRPPGAKATLPNK